MSVVLNNPSFHENLGTFFDPLQHNPHHLHHLSPPHHQFPSRGGGGDNFLLNGKSPRLISASWETLERLPRMSPPTSESITSHLLSTPSSSSPTSSSAAAAAAAYYDYSFFYKVICTPEFLKSAKENYIQPMLDMEFNQIVLPVECGKNCAFMYLTRLCQGSKGPCILFNGCYWLTPNEFQSISGRNSAKDWKRSIRHNGKSIKLLINKGILTVHSPLCDCAYGSGIEPFVEKYSMASSSPPTIASPTTSLDVRAIPYGTGDFECSRSDGGTGGSEDDPDNDENISSSTSSDVCGSENEKEYDKHASTDEEEKIDVVETTSSVDEENLKSEDGFDSTTTTTTYSSQVTPYHAAENSAAESQAEESSTLSVSNNNSSKLNGDQSNGSGSERGNGSERNSSTTPTHKSKRKPSTKQVHQHKPSAEQQSPTHLSSTTSSPPMTPPPMPLPPPQSSLQSTEGERGNHGTRSNSGGGGSNNNHSNNNGSSGGSSPPQQPIKQMEQMMSASSRNYSDFMRSLAAKYNHQSNHNNDHSSYPFPNLSFDTRFLKPAVAHAFLNLSQLPSPVLLDKDKFPMIDMSSTQTLLSMVRSASAAAAAAAAVNNNNNNNTANHNNNNNNDGFSTKSGSGSGTKRPNSPLDLSAREIPPLKKGKLKTSSSPLDLMMQNKHSPNMMMAAAAAAAAGATGQMGQGLSSVCMSSCASGCSEEAQIMINWSVDDVCHFVANIDLCKDYVEIFRDHSIDGSALPLLTEEHLMTAMNMKLGPALKFRSTVAKRLGNCVICSHCTHCHNHNNN